MRPFSAIPSCKAGPHLGPLALGNSHPLFPPNSNITPLSCHQLTCLSPHLVLPKGKNHPWFPEPPERGNMLAELHFPERQAS